MSENSSDQPSFRIEAMRESDIPAVERLEDAVHLIRWGADSYRNDLRSSHSILLIARSNADGNELIGFLNAWIVGDEFQLHNLAVLPASQRQGIGAALLAAALREAIARSATCGVLEVRASNTTAQKLYERFSFKTVLRRKDYYHDPVEDALLMICDDLCTAASHQ